MYCKEWIKVWCRRL